jgi:hypothetical protein
MLKIFAGADPAAVYAGRGDWHRAKLAELEGYLENLRAGREGNSERLREDKWRGAEATLVGGIAYHRQMIDTFERFIERRARDSPYALAASEGSSRGEPSATPRG